MLNLITLNKPNLSSEVEFYRGETTGPGLVWYSLSSNLYNQPSLDYRGGVAP